MKLLASIGKEVLLLWRDRAGMVILFAMPMVLVLTVTLVQEEEAYKTTGVHTMTVLLVDEDQGAFGRYLAEGVPDAVNARILTELDGQALTREVALKAVSRGDYQICILIPKGTSDRVRQRTKDELARVLSAVAMPDEAEPRSNRQEDAGADSGAMQVYLDPALRLYHRKSVMGSLQSLAQTIETKTLLAAMASVMSGVDSASPSDVEPDYTPGSLVPIREETTDDFLPPVRPTSVQQNVPAWTLFAMFLIVIPLSGSMIRERQDGTFARLRTLPVSLWTILAGKTLTYAAVCLLQFAAMLIVGTVLLPWLGTPELEMGPNILAVWGTALSAALAATGLGILVGTLARSYEQASAFGSAFVVISAALGGVMVPVFLMPSFMRPLSRLSPMNWGLNAFLDIFLREGGLGTVAPNLLLLLAFFGVTVSFAVVCSLWHE